MKELENKIVFSEDINLIMKGRNAFNFNYEDNNISVPSESFIKDLRINFEEIIQKIFDKNYYIVKEDEAFNYLNDLSMKESCPHCITR